MIVQAGLPPLNTGVNDWGDWVIAVADLGSGPILLQSVASLDRDRWLTPGLTVPIAIDPTRIGADDPHLFAIDWASVPTIRDRVAANDPTLTDPRSAWRAAIRAEAGAAKPPRPPMSRGASRHLPNSGPRLEVESWSAACDEAIARTAITPAPPGRFRAVAIPCGVRMVFSDLTRDFHGRPNPQTDQHGQIHWRAMRGNEVVLSINIAGRLPYAMFVPRLKSPKNQSLGTSPSLYPWLPVTVTPDDRESVEVLWDEAVENRSRPSSAAEAQVRAEMIEQLNTQARAAHGIYGPQPAGPPSADGVPPYLHSQAARFAQVLQSTPVPLRPKLVQQLVDGLGAVPAEQREAYLAVFRSQGIPV